MSSNNHLSFNQSVVSNTRHTLDLPWFFLHAAFTSSTADSLLNRASTDCATLRGSIDNVLKLVSYLPIVGGSPDGEVTFGEYA